MDAYKINLTSMSNDTLFQVYCIQPPDDSCEFGPCPNSDVTGLGQQISLYVTSTIFAITLVHSPQNAKVAWYSYLTNVYSLFISGLISIFNSQLSQNDAVFVLVATVSPGTIYLWVISILDLCRRLPTSISSLMSNQREQVVLITLSLVSFVLWAIMLILVTAPSHRINFSQPACNTEYGKEQIISLGWSLYFFISVALISTFLLVVDAYLRKHRRSRNQAATVLTLREDLIQWTRTSLKKNLGRFVSSPRDVAAVLFMMQLYALQAIDIYYLTSITDGLAAVLALVMIWGVPHSFRNVSQVTLRIVLSVSMAGYLAVPYFFSPGSTFSLLFIISHGCWLTIWWCEIGARCVGQRKSTVLLKQSSLIILVIWLSLLNIFTPFSISLHVTWFLLWQICEFLPSSSGWSWENAMKLWSRIMDSAHFFKFMFLVAVPTISWIGSTIISNPTSSSTMTFGQIFSVLVAAASLLSFAITCYHGRGAVVKALWVIEEPNGSNNVIPMQSLRSTSAATSPPSPSTGATTSTPSLLPLTVVSGRIDRSLPDQQHRIKLDNATRRQTA